jgi:aminoglycoside phosphotransferase
LDVVAGPAEVVAGEATRLAWLAERAVLPTCRAGRDAGKARSADWPAVPVVVGHVVDGARGWLVTERPTGAAADSPASLADPEGAITGFGPALRAFHGLPLDACPFDASVDALLARARARVEAGLIDAEQFQPLHRRYTPAQLLAHVEAFAPVALRRPRTAPAVLTHGRAELGNVLVDDHPAAAPAGAEPQGRVVGWRRLEALGVGDPYRDLAVAAASLARRFDAGALPLFFDAYGLPEPDPVRLELFVLLDEFR